MCCQQAHWRAAGEAGHRHECVPDGPCRDFRYTCDNCGTRAIVADQVPSGTAGRTIKHPLRGNRLVCGRCQQVTYCSATCQAEHWHAGHKLECRAPEEAREGGGGGGGRCGGAGGGRSVELG